MSFILDALKKSESERQQQQSGEFSSVPSRQDPSRVSRWIWIVGALLLVNLVVVAGLALRPGPTLTSLPAADGPAQSAPPVADNDAAPAEASFEDRLSVARRSQPAAGPGPADAGADSPAAARNTVPLASAPETSPAAPAGGVATLPSLEELQLKGAIELPPLHIDLHVYNDSPERRFVSINMFKYRENEHLREGPLVRRITREGVVLEYQGKSFALVQ